ncbi:hypothetical protein ACIQ6Y_31080 [Streptomyces sp. NPDC096205]|uniref:hypothetical protein n=1 Tax=Streptomyces sp. NPDC096205 TaxID=3366081 RepID=UPI0037F600F9
MRIRSARRAVAVSGLALAVVANLPATAVAGGGKGGGKNGGFEGSGKGSAQDGVIRAKTKVTVTTSGAPGSSKNGTLTPSNSNWTPPACWYEPSFSPKEIEATVKAWRGIDFLPFLTGIGDAVGNVLDYRYKDGNPYKNYNLDKQGEGMFWAAVKNPNRKDDPEANSCDKQPFWVDAGKPPAEPLAVSPKILAEYAYDELPVPGTEIEMAPTGESTVNLPTWIWLDKAKFRKISVTAGLPGTGLSATTTAEPVSLHIDPGTAGAETYPASGECVFKGDGSIGEPYAKGKADQTPPCGVTYLRSTGTNGAYALKATVTWKITWTSTTGEGGKLPDGTFGATQDVTVREIQSVNR